MECFSFIRKVTFTNHNLFDITPFIHSFIHSRCYLTTCPLPLPKQVLYRTWHNGSSFNFQYSLFYLNSFSICLRFLPCLSITSTFPSTFPSILCFRRKILRNMWPVKLDALYLLFVGCLCLPWPVAVLRQSHTICLTIFFILLQHHISILYTYFWSLFQNVQVSVP
jgi:hypothetical protein